MAPAVAGRIRRLVWQLVTTVLVVGLAMWAAVTWLPPAVPIPKLVARPGDRQVKLEWTVASDFRGVVEYRQKRAGGVFSEDGWMSVGTDSNHVVRRLKNGLVYVFQARALHESRGSSAPSDEAVVVPFGPTEDFDQMEAQLLALKRDVAALMDGSPCMGSVLGEIQFAHGSTSVIPRSDAQLAAQNEAQLNAIVENLQCAEAGGVVAVTGYASAPGRATYNLDLSELRAEAVMEYLERSGAWDGEFHAIAEGEGRGRLGGRYEAEDRRVVVALCEVGAPPAD